jgi:hypothetical protein
MITTLAYVGNKLLENSNYYKLSNTTNYIVLGDSEPECSFNDSLINNLINLSNSGESYFYTYLKARKIIPNNKQIQAVFIGFSNNSISMSADSTIWNDLYLPIRLPTYFPLMDYDHIRLLRKKNKDFLNFVPKSILRNIFRNYKYLLCKEKGFKKDDRFGSYLYLSRNKTDSIVLDASQKGEPGKTPYHLSHLSIKYLSKLINFCGEHKIKTFIIRSPVHEISNDSLNKQFFQELLPAEYSNIEFLDFSKFPLSNSEFGDLEHINHKGAYKFSMWFDRLLKNGILDKTNKQTIINEEIKALAQQQ